MNVNLHRTHPVSSIPSEIRCAHDYESLAKRFLDTPAYAYIAGGSRDDVTAQANRAAFNQYSVVPRLLRDVAAGHTRLTLNGQLLAHPIMLAPVAHQKLAHDKAELESARAANATETTMVLSTLSSYTLEEVAQHAGAHRWFQLYFQPHRESTLHLLQRAKLAGFSAIVVTLDAAIQLPSHSAIAAGFRLPAECTTANLLHYPAAPLTALSMSDSRIFQGAMHTAPTWKDLDWLIKHSPLPIWVKGVLHPEDALKLKEHGVAGIVISNHGGRSLDGAPASLRMLPEIRTAIGNEYPVLFDSGIRGGSDVFKAIALGADAVLIGRLQVYALAVAGALGVAHMLKLLREELEACMALAGCATLEDIRYATLLKQS